MLTALEESGKNKSEKYWPDQDDQVLDLSNAGIVIYHEMTNYTGDYFQR